MSIDKVYKQNWIETKSLALETTSGNKISPVSLPRVKWLERDPDCKYQPAPDAATENSELEPIPVLGRRQHKNVKWSPEEDLLLLSLLKQRMPESEVASKLNRTVKSILGRLNRLGYEHKKIIKWRK